ncbi:Uncharacterised protein [Yersinia enterocolitica]|nr:Uncharacterised protein [Yersinia enterocolitica]
MKRQNKNGALRGPVSYQLYIITRLVVNNLTVDIRAIA